MSFKPCNSYTMILDQLFKAQSPAGHLVVLRVIRLGDGIAAKQDIQLGRLAHTVLTRNGLAAIAHEGPLEARAGNA
jgi:hypothetical protein